MVKELRMKIGFIGLGVMGKSMAINILRAGYELTVFDVVKENVDDLVKKGAKSGITPADVAAQSDVVLTSLPNASIVEQVFLGESGILEGASEGTIYVDLSSITPKSIRRINDIAAKKSIYVVDAPVSGGAEGAEKGTLTIMAGGEKTILDKVLPVLNCIGKEITHVGNVGAGDTVKAVNNLLLGANMVAVAEALVLGKKAGLDPDIMYDIISKSSGNSYALTAKYEKYISKGNFNPGFMVNLMHKDLQLAIDTAKDLDYPLLFGNISQQMFEIAKAEGMGTEDISSVIKIFEKWANVEVRDEEHK
jgi:3-hydroxyisobutyrate dehydrogenase